LIEMRREFRATAQTGAKTGLLCGSSTREKDTVFLFWRGSRAGRTTVNAGRQDSGEEASIEAAISRLNCPITGIVIKSCIVHAVIPEFSSIILH
jgi:hypothetical protein